MKKQFWIEEKWKNIEKSFFHRVNFHKYSM